MATDDAQKLFFEPDGGIPNSRLPLVFWQGRLPREARSGECGDGAVPAERLAGNLGLYRLSVLAFPHARP